MRPTSDGGTFPYSFASAAFRAQQDA
jgi:hypothetical protein